MNVEIIKAWMTNFNEKIQDNHEYLSQLDTEIGDGDHGNNMVRGMNATMTAINKDFPDNSSIFKAIAMALISNVGGASGPLYGTVFLEMSKVTTDNLSDYLQAAVDGIKKRGQAEVGDKTMLDVWYPTAEISKSRRYTPDDVVEAVNQTQPMEAKKGRASYLGERSVGHLDPGAVSTGYLLEALLEAMK